MSVSRRRFIVGAGVTAVAAIVGTQALTSLSESLVQALPATALVPHTALFYDFVTQLGAIALVEPLDVISVDGREFRVLSIVETIDGLAKVRVEAI
jgi:hypothetical protein